jgi:hypothetical protein
MLRSLKLFGEEKSPQGGHCPAAERRLSLFTDLITRYWTRMRRKIAASIVVAVAATAAALAAPLDDPVLDAANAYLSFHADAAAIGQSKLDNADDLERSLALGARHSPDALTRGWIAYGAVIAAQSPAFAAGVRSVSARYGRAAVLQALDRDPSYPARRRGYDEAVGILLAADDAFSRALHRDSARWEAAASAAPAWPPFATDTAERVKRLRSLAEAPQTDKPVAATIAAPAANKTLRPGPARAAIVRRMATLAAMRVLRADGIWRARMVRMMDDQPTRECIRAQHLQYYQCVSVTYGVEPAYCLARHALEGVNACMSNLPPSR